ncbi:ATP-binding protein [Vulgatibacter sp.]|uniref:ATP-binding protein n=1 Tax=Vulgatibacter sp. TaxID=1971226 RepID=UPI00356A1EFF
MPEALPAAPNDRPGSSPLVGRQEALAKLTSALANQRLVTLLGPPGVGKTRLALEAAATGLFCDLTEARDEAALLLHVLHALGASAPLDASAAALSERIRAALGEMGPEAVLVLDNFEQLPPAADKLVAAWADAGPRILVTTRRRLATDAAHALVLAPLSLQRAEAGWSDAAALLAARAAFFAGRPFDTAPEREAIEQLAAGLDGLPLALELAAARLRLLSPAQLLDKLSARFRLLRRPDGSLGRSDLHESLGASFSMLGEEERGALAALSVFRGGFTLEAAEAVLGDDGAVWPLDHLQSLLDHSVLLIDDDPLEKRYRLLVCVREYAAQEGDAALLAGAARRHAQHTVEAAGKHLAADPRRLLLERENLVAVVERAAVVGADHALRAADLLTAPPCRLPYATVERYLDLALAAGGDERLRCRALVRRGTIRRFLARLDEADADLQAAAEIARAVGDRPLLAEALAGLGHNASAHAAYPETRRYLAAAAEADPDPRHEGRALVMLANSYCNEDEHDHAEALFRQALPVTRRGDEDHWHAMALLGLGVLRLEVGAVEEARSLVTEALPIFRRLASEHWEGVAIGFLARCSQERGELAQALARYAEGLVPIEKAGVRRAEAVARLHFASALLEAGMPADAAGQLRRAHGLTRSTCADHEGFVLALLAAAARMLGDEGEADRLFARAGEALGRYKRPIWRAALEVLQGGTPPADLAACSDVRLACRIAAKLPQHLAATTAPPLVVAADGSFFEAPGAGGRVPLHRRKAIRGVLRALVRHRQEKPGVAVELPLLIEAGWPGERIVVHAAADRVYAAIATLRRLGLRGVLLQQDEGYLLDPDQPIELR